MNIAANGDSNVNMFGDGLVANTHSDLTWNANSTGLDSFLDHSNANSTHHTGLHHQRRCACCYKPLSDYEPYIEYLYKFYHNECFRCHMCLKNFSSSTPSSSQSASASMNEDAMSIVINKYGQLVCLKDYIE